MMWKVDDVQDYAVDVENAVLGLTPGAGGDEVEVICCYIHTHTLTYIYTVCICTSADPPQLPECSWTRFRSEILQLVLNSLPILPIQ